ncbi:MAG: YdcF family protein [Alphaproteobacteria bacterium]
MRLAIKILNGLVIVAVIALILGFVGFSRTVATLAGEVPTTKAQAIVVFTGGKDRVDRAIVLLELGWGARLLISGVHPANTKSSLKVSTGKYPNLFECCIDIDHVARDTIGNARETAAWAKARHFSSLLVVTSAYHLPRAMAELGAVLPNAKLTPYPVVTPAIDYANWWLSPDGWRLLSSEYLKNLATRGRLFLQVLR